MRDLELWRRLGSDEGEPAALVPLLRELAELPITERFPFFGLLPQALAHAEEGVRAAAVAALHGAGGILAFRQLVRALHDPEPAVRLAAVQALRESVEHDPPRWIHALFHPDVAIRREALAAPGLFPMAAWHALYLLPDPACADLALDLLTHQTAPPAVLPLVFEYLERGLLARRTGRTLIAAMSWPSISQGLSRWQKRDAGQVAEILEQARGGTLKLFDPASPAPSAGVLDVVRMPDPLDALFDLFWDAGMDGEVDPETRQAAVKDFYDRLLRAALALDEAEQRRLVAALLVTGARRGSWPEQAAAVLAVCHPLFLTFSWVPQAVRYRAVRGLYALGEHCPRKPVDFVRQLLLADLCRRPSGGLDLWIIGGLLHFLEKHPYQQLQEWLGLNPIVAAFLEDIEHSVPFLCLRDASELGRNYLLNEICGQRRPRQAFLMALLVWILPVDQLDFLPALDFDGAMQLFSELLNLVASPLPSVLGMETTGEVESGVTLSDKKLRHLGEVLGGRIAGGPIDVFLCVWLTRPAPEELALGLQILGVQARLLDVQPILDAACGLDLEQLKKFLRAVAWCAGFPYAKEVQLAQVLLGHPDQEVRDWANLRASPGERPAPPRRKPVSTEIARLSASSADTIARCSEASLSRAVKGCLAAPMLGLCEALAQRSAPRGPNLLVCLALLAAHDPVEHVDEQFARFGSEEPAFLHRLEEEMVKTWLPELRLPLLGHAWLYRWNEHNRAFHDRLLYHWPAGLAEALRFVQMFVSGVLRRRLWEALALLVNTWRWCEKPRLTAIVTEALGVVLLEALEGREADVAARILVQLHDAAVRPDVLDDWKARAVLLLPDLREEIRRILKPWIDARGLMGGPVPRRASPALTDPALVTAIRACSDLEQLEAWCAAPSGKVAEEAALRLLELGEPGVACLARLLRQAPVPAAATTIAITVALWPEGHALQEMRALARDADATPVLRFLIGTSLLERGESDFLESVLDVACRESARPWFRPEDWQRFVHLGVAELTLARRLVVSPQPHAYTLAVRYLLARTAGDALAEQALLTFLEAGTERLHTLRHEAAVWLHQSGNHAAFPLLLQHEAEAEQPKYPALLQHVAADLVQAAVTAALTAGPKILAEKVLLDLLQADGVDVDARHDGYRRLLIDGAVATVKSAVLTRLKPARSRALKLRRLAESFAWGVRTGRELTGKVFAVEMIAGQSLGYTRFNQNKIYINPLPLLRGEEDGQDTVEALIIHELGHHVYHRGPEPEAVWKEAEQQGLHSLLNLVADEHLERNLRALDTTFGNKLKRLDAYAFQHADKEVVVSVLLEGLQGRALEVLTATRLGVARKAGCVVVESGRILLEMEKAGMSFARFVRALRMGLGNRHRDPQVAAGLRLFKTAFRKSSMNDLWQISKQLHEIFGWQVQLLNSFGQDAILSSEDSDLLGHGEGITNDEVQSEIQRVLEPRKAKDSGTGKGKGGRWLNVNPDERFEPITTVTPIPYDPIQHAVYAQQVARPARHMRQYLEQLGLALEPQRFRLRGKSLDRTRIPAVVLRGDPRMLVARETQIHTDLFLGVVIDCSGSMGHANHMEQAKLFGAMLAEAARGFRGIDLRLFGFTDRVIFDAGTANRCAVHGLQPTGGNNDAAGLWHAAQAALASHRKAKLLVMISDGMPTECSVAALRGLVQRLTRRLKICCAQVAVQHLEEVCFPHYVLLEEANPAASVRRFGTIIARLVQKALRGS